MRTGPGLRAVTSGPGGRRAPPAPPRRRSRSAAPRAEPHRPGAGGDEGVQLVRGDAALRTDHAARSRRWRAGRPWSAARSPPRAGRTPRRQPASRRATVAGGLVGRAGHHRQPGAAGLLGRLPGGVPPTSPGRVRPGRRATGPPSGTPPRARSRPPRPRSSPAPPARPGRPWRCPAPPRAAAPAASTYPRSVTASSRLPRPTAVTTAVGRAAPAVGEQQLLADAQPLHVGGVVPLRPVQGQAVGRRQRSTRNSGADTITG